MPISVQRTLDFNNVARITNLPDPAAAQEPATRAYVDSAIEGLAWKDSVRVRTQGNVNLAAPGATIDGITMVSGDRYLASAQTTTSENGIYIWNGAATPSTRSLDASTFAELEQAVTTVEEGTNAGVTYRQTAVNGTIGVTAVTWTNFGTAAPAATTTTAGIVELATQGEADAGTDANVVITPSTLSNSVWAARKFNQTFGDGSATSFAITHNLNTRDLNVEVQRTSGNFDTVLCEVQRTSVNQITLIFDSAPAANAFRVHIKA